MKDILMANSTERVKYILAGYMRDEYSIGQFDYGMWASRYLSELVS
jgi:hypothetical protein